MTDRPVLEAVGEVLLPGERIDGIEWPYRERDGFAGWCGVYRDWNTLETFYGCRRASGYHDKQLYRLKVYLKPVGVNAGEER